jgi:hypothetical protein
MNNVMVFGRYRDDDRDGRGNGLSIIVILVIGIVCSFIAYIFTLITRFAISRRREYMADAGGAELCGNPMALASALRKISANPGLGGTNREDVAQLFIIRPAFAAKDVMSFISSLFSTHPDTQKRIEVLEQFYSSKWSCLFWIESRKATPFSYSSPRFNLSTNSEIFCNSRGILMFCGQCGSHCPQPMQWSAWRIFGTLLSKPIRYSRLYLA